jgi:predicted Zn-ribbon and HTH transcriptional regulator
MTSTITLPTLNCQRCGATWHPRQAKPPRKCPKCFSDYWHTPAGVLPKGRPWPDK